MPHHHHYTLLLLLLHCLHVTFSDYSVKLIDGFSPNEGTFIVLHNSSWGFICDDGFNLQAANVACRQAGFGDATNYFTGNHFKSNSKYPILLDQLRCRGDETSLDMCQSNPIGQHDCQPSEASGARCFLIGQSKLEPMILRLSKMQFNRTSELVGFTLDFHVLRTDTSGILLANINSTNVTVGFCVEEFTLREATVACRQLGKGYGKYLKQFLIADMLDYGLINDNKGLSMTGACLGNETSLSSCAIFSRRTCKIADQLVGIRCISDLPDLVPDVQAVQTSGYLTDIPLFYMTCAMEENCLSPIAYQIRKVNSYWMYQKRRLLRFSSIIANDGTADFLPLEVTSKWQWHTCHLHYHSMAYFAHYEIFETTKTNRIVATGHKASFCLEDNVCRQGAQPRFKCSEDSLERGSQGISPGCKDIYLHDLDCQWVDVTEVQPGSYKFRLIVNPQFKVAESSYFNNAVLCDLKITHFEARFSNCKHVHPLLS